MAPLPKECVTPLQPLARGLGSNAVVLLRQYEAKLIDPVTGKPGEWNTLLLRCGQLYLDQMERSP